MDNFSAVSPSFTFYQRDGALGEIRVKGVCEARLSAAIVQRVKIQAMLTGRLAGLVLDLRQSAALSIVCTVGLIDALCRLGIPLAVVLPGEPQRQLARLLHPTLSHRGRTAYTTSPGAAWEFLNTCRRSALN